jgi:hypothetical protein
MESELHTNQTEPVKPETFASMRQAAGAKGVSVSTLRNAKASGCPGFHQSGRVNWAQVEPWLASNANNLPEDEESKEHWELFKLRADAQRSQLALETAQGKHLSKDEVAAQITQLSSAAKSVLRTTLEDELPAKIQGLDAIAIKAVMAQAVDEICSIFERGFSQWK